ncbi:hypothetical protein C8Q77DRAFT_1153833 [Trametes polyzona]|nr:hypothetical protein C8Q77DRAFT_1153833 [Trametes polyzona]
MAPRRKCPVCGSKQWHKEPSSGLITCSEGHVLQNYRNETREVTELGPHAVRKRNLKSGRKKKERQSKADPKFYHGERARFHYFQCLQLLLRMQIAALTRLRELPPEFELICRDIWALNIALLPNPPSPDPLLHANDGLRDELPLENAPSASREVDEKDKSEDDKSASSSSDSSDTGSSSSESETSDSELEELMRENSETPTEDEDEGTSTPKPKPSSRPSRKRRTFGQYDAPASTISCLVIACWTLRLPVIYTDFVRLVESYDLPYLDLLRLLPESMTSHLRKHTAQALSPHYPPTPLHLHRLTSRLARLMYSTYDIYTPEMNAAPILWKAVQSLHGTPTVYVLTKALAKLVSIPSTLHRSLAPALARTKKRDPTFHKQDSAIPEVALVAAVIVVMKMMYGLDGSPRHPQEADDPACALPALPELIRALRAAQEAEETTVSPMSTDRHCSVLDMDDRMLDDYLQFCEKALLPREDLTPARNVAADHFPLDEPSTTPLIASSPAIPDTAEGTAMNATAVDRYPRHYPPDLELVVARAARWAGVDEDYVLGVVERFERRVFSWLETVRRKERAGRASASE